MSQQSSIDELAQRAWEESLAWVPAVATMFGVHDHDDRMGSVTPDAEAARRRELVALRDEVAAVTPSDRRDRVVHASLATMLDQDLVALGGEGGRRTSHTVLHSDHMNGAHLRVLRTLPMLTYPAPEHAEQLPSRYADVDRFLAEWADRFVAAADGRSFTPATRTTRHVLAQLDGYLGSPLEQDPLVDVSGPADWDGEDAWRQRLRAAVAESVRPGLARYRERLAEELLPHGRDDDHPGLCHLDGGGELYAARMVVATGLELDPDEVHRTGLEHITGQLAQEWAELGARTHGVDDPRELMDVLRADDSASYDSGEDVLAHARATVERARDATGDWFGRLPRTDLVVEAIPEYEADSGPPAYYMRPAPDGSRPGTYHVNARRHQSVRRTQGEAIAFHEAIPGHHLQLAIATELDDAPAFMRMGSFTAYIEGWGLYSERLADEMGLYSSDLDRLGMLSFDAFRASRLVVDTGIHALGWSRQRAIDWMTRHTPLSHELIANEVDRYVAVPGQALAYKLGQLEIRRLRDRAEEQLGERFDVRGFHDVVLGEGALPLPVLRDVVERWVESHRT